MKSDVLSSQPYEGRLNCPEKGPCPNFCCSKTSSKITTWLFSRHISIDCVLHLEVHPIDLRQFSLLAPGWWLTWKKNKISKRVLPTEHNSLFLIYLKVFFNKTVFDGYFAAKTSGSKIFRRVFDFIGRKIYRKKNKKGQSTVFCCKFQTLIP